VACTTRENAFHSPTRGECPRGDLQLLTNASHLQTPELCYVYSEHTHPVKCAKFSPSGKYVASGDAAGKVRVWAWTAEAHGLKVEVPALGGEVEDLAWDSESKRILAVGGGQSKAKVFMWDTGSNLAEVVPHNKKAITGDLRPARPYRMITGGEDHGMQWYEGPPFKYNKGLKDHTNFVNCIRFSPDGSRFISVSSDKAGLVFEGEGATLVGKLDTSGGHTGGVYYAAWSADSKSAVTVGGDKSVRVWDLSGAGPTFPCTSFFVVGAKPEDMQQSVAWADSTTIISTSLDGTLNYFNAADVAAGPTRRVAGHQSPMQMLTLDRSTGRMYSGCAGGRVCVWSPQDEARTVYSSAVATGEIPTKRIAGVSAAGGIMAAAAWDDKLRVGDAATGVFTVSVPCGAQPKGLAVVPTAPTLVVVVTGSAVLVVKGGTVASTTAAAWAPTCVDVSADGKSVAVGGGDKKVHLFTLDTAAGKLTAVGETKEAPAAISVVALSPDSALLAAGDAGREVRLYTASTLEALMSSRWMNHTTRVTGLAWSPSGAVLASVSTDRRLCVWSPKSDTAVLSLDLAHPQPFTACAFASENELWTLGADGIATRRVLTL